jgi:AAA+ superfamily predicted ATPase
VTRRSLLFYGPPGTGKTYFQRLIAGELKWPLTFLTSGDFLTEGEDKVAARTVKVFDQLKYISNACIVFDEFDEIVVRRGAATNSAIAHRH